ASRHEQSLAEREKAVGHIRTTDLSLFFHPSPAGSPARLFTAEVTLGIDHFRGYLGSLKNIFGGEIRSYQKTLDRARREALMRVVEQAHAEGYNAIANVRLEFVDVSGSANMAKRPAMVSILASGTAYITKSPLNGEERPVIPPPVIV
ncbi:MAG: YbjQ family protein, partial [Kiritimatiellia bacterium]